MQVGKPLQPSAQLKTTAPSQQGPTLTTRGGYQVSTPAGTDDVVVQLNNVEVLRIKLGADMTIKTQGTLRLDATDIELVCRNNLKAMVGNSVDVKASLNTSVTAGNDLSMTGGRTVTVNGNTVDVDGGTINLN